MCNFNAILGLFATAEALMIVAVAATIASAVANASFFGIPGAVAGYVGAGLAFFGAMALLNGAAGDLSMVGCNNPACAAQHASVMTAIRALQVALGAASAAAIATAILAGVPVVGAVALGSTAVAFGAVAALVVNAAIDVAALERCITNAQSVGSTAIIVVAVIIALPLAALAIAFAGATSDRGGELTPKPRGND